MGLTRIDTAAALEAVTGKTVAVVGNSRDVLERGHGDRIEEHDVVIRMNHGVPTEDRRHALGRRTDILATAIKVPRALFPAATPRSIWWMKLTTVGRKDLEEFEKDAQRRWGPTRLWPWPRILEDEVQAFVGSPPSTGIRLLYVLRTRTAAARISTFGCTWWGLACAGSDRNWWRPGRARAEAHVPENEYRAFLALGFDEAEEGWFVAR